MQQRSLPRSMNVQRGSVVCPVASRARQRVVSVSSELCDTSVRVKGDLRRVYRYVGDFQNLTDWYPGVKSVTKVRGKGEQLTINTRFEVNREIARFNLKSFYDLADLEPNKRVIYTATSEWHSATHQIFFQADPNDKSFTNIRYIKRLQLKSYAGPLQPVLAGALSKIPEQGLTKLARLLQSPSTPLNDLAPEPQYANARGGNGNGHGGGAPWGMGGGGGWPSINHQAWGGLTGLQNFMSGLSMGTGSNGTQKVRKPSSSPQAQAAAAAVGSSVDTLGFYAVLGLDPARNRSLSEDDVRKAYRKAAAQMHPDKFSLSDDETKADAEMQFQRLQKAYTVLRDPEQRRMYDQGKILEDMVV